MMNKITIPASAKPGVFNGFMIDSFFSPDNGICYAYFYLLYLKITIFFLYIVRHLAVFASIALEFMRMGAYRMRSCVDAMQMNYIKTFYN